jgi:hypothetical protein
MTLYTIYSSDKGQIESGLTLKQAAEYRLSHDGSKYELVQTDEGMTEIHGKNGVWYNGPEPHGRPLRAWRGSHADQISELYMMVIQASWDDGLEVMTDDDFAARQAKWAREDAELSA